MVSNYRQGAGRIVRKLLERVHEINEMPDDPSIAKSALQLNAGFTAVEEICDLVTEHSANPGAIKSARKSAASRVNGRKGGRPPKEGLRCVLCGTVSKMAVKLHLGNCPPCWAKLQFGLGRTMLFSASKTEAVPLETLANGAAVVAATFWRKATASPLETVWERFVLACWGGDRYVTWAEHKHQQPDGSFTKPATTWGHYFHFSAEDDHEKYLNAWCNLLERAKLTELIETTSYPHSRALDTSGAPES